MTVGHSIHVHLHYARCAFQRLAAYRLANWTGITVNLFFFLIHAQVYLAFFAGRADVSGWSPRDAILYLGTVEALIMVLGIFPAQMGYDFAERVRTGHIAVDLVRPVALYARALAERFGSALYYTLTRAIAVYAFALVFWSIPAPTHLELLWFPVSLCLAIATGGLLTYLAHATAFWFESARGAVHALALLFSFFGGAIVPLDFYPEALRTLCDLLPFRSVVYTPVALATGKLEGASLGFALAHQTVWVTVLVLLSRSIEGAGVRKLVAHGG